MLASVQNELQVVSHSLSALVPVLEGLQLLGVRLVYPRHYLRRLRQLAYTVVHLVDGCKMCSLVGVLSSYTLVIFLLLFLVQTILGALLIGFICDLL